MSTQPATVYELEIPAALADKLAALGYADPLDGLHAAAKLLVGLGPEAWGTITRAAQDQKVTPAKVVLGLMSSADTSTGEGLPAARARRTANTARDQEIWAMAKAGSTHAVIAARFGLSPIRISQIVSTQRARAKAAEEAANNAVIDSVAI